MKAEVSDLKDSLEVTENIIEKKVEKLETELDNLEDKVRISTWQKHARVLLKKDCKF